ncbi:MAG: type IV secretory system conjugative DNA transfer family protein [Phycisphaerales bacterium]|jgi:type IV secretion system protein VirD4
MTRTKDSRKRDELGHSEKAASPAGLLIGRREETARGFGFGPHAVIAQPKSTEVRVQGHGAVFSRSGGGKMTCSAGVNVLAFSGAQAIVVDPKGEITQVCARECRKRGPVVIIDPFEALGPNTGFLNPMDRFKIPALAGDDAADTLAAEMSAGHGSEKDPYWVTSARALCAGACASVGADPDPSRRNLNTVLDMLAGSSGDTTYELAKAMDDKRIYGEFAKARIAEFLEVPDSSSGSTRSCILSSARQFLHPLSGSRIRECLKSTSFDLSVLLDGEEPLTVFVVFPPMRAVSHGGLLRLILSTLLQVLAARPVMPSRSTLLLVDEAANVGKCDLFPLLYSYGRGQGISVLTEWQSLGQMMSIYERDWRTIVENASAIQCFNLSTTAVDPHSALLGVSPTTLPALGPDEQLVAIAEREPEILKRIDYRTDATLFKLADANPRYERVNVAADRSERGTHREPAN